MKKTLLPLTVTIGGIIALVCLINNRNEVAHVRNVEAQKMCDNDDRLMKAGYRCHNGVWIPGTRDELWQDGSRCDHKYVGRDQNGAEVTIFAMNGEQKVYGQRTGYDARTDTKNVTIELAGTWIAQGKVHAWPIGLDGQNGQQYDVQITGEL